MSVYLFQETEPFEEISENLRRQGVSRASQVLVRRPTRGLQGIKNTYAYLKVVDRGNYSLPLINSSSPQTMEPDIGISTTYANFMLQSVQIARAEMRQFQKTFGLNYLFLFGENPVMLTVQGSLLHSADFRWDEEWWVNYERLLRGTELARLEARVYLCYEGVMIEGYPLTATTQRSANEKYLVSLAFEMVATNIKYLANVGSTTFPITGTIFDYRKPHNFGGQSINSVLPMGRQIAYNNQSAVAMLSNPGGLSAEVSFGSFQDLFMTMSVSPWLLPGTTDPLALRGAEYGLSKPVPLAAPVFGKFSDVPSEYVAGDPNAPTLSGNNPFTEQNRTQSFMQFERPETESARAGEAARQITTGEDVNLANVDGVGTDSGIGVLEDRELNPNATAPSLVPSPFSNNPGYTPPAS